MAKIENKNQYLDLWLRELLGNRLRTWKTFQELKKDGYKGLVSIRTKERGIGGSGLTLYNQTIQEAKRYNSSKYYFNESAPDEKLILQGEIQRSINFYDLTYSTEKTKMNLALKNSPKHMTGSKVLYLLKSLLSPNSYDDLMDLFDEYPDSIIEFGIYEYFLGNCKNRNCIIWEVRDY